MPVPVFDRIDIHCTDDVDGLPVHDFAAGDLLPDGSSAWERLGVGRRCETWLAWSVPRWCPVVVKLARPHQIDHPRARGSLRREVSALEGLEHPALPRLYADGTDAAVPYVTGEHVDGPALDEEIEDNGPLSEPDAALLATQLLAALRCLHANGRAHCDVKPDNIVLRGGHRPVLLDFGSARRLDARQPADSPIGSPGYASPDLEAGAPISAAMDLFGVGVTLYEALSGRPAFDPDVDAADRPAPVPLAAGPMADLITALSAPDPGARPNLSEALRVAGGVARRHDRLPWPLWVTYPAS